MAEIITFGCRLNACESDIIQDFADELGIEDYTIINTCAVTAEAERKLRQAIRKLNSEGKSIILTGCAAQLNPKYYLSMPGVIGIISNTMKLRKSEYENYGGGAPQKTPRSKVRGFLQIQNGCDNHCTYCIVRVTRGPNVSFDKDEIVVQAQKLLKKGYKEIVLTGVNISSYGRDFPEAVNENLARLIRYVLKNVPNLQRLRLSSLDPADFDKDLLDMIANEERLMPHIHESIQSGDNLILKRMRRRHTREMLIETNAKILEARPNMIFGADFIVGFPTENDEMFENTKKLFREANLSLLHVFKYSKRPGTPAAAMPQVAKQIKIDRMHHLKHLANEILREKMQSCVGQIVNALAEDEHNAKTDNFLPIKSVQKMQAGRIYKMCCVDINNDSLLGDLID